MQLLCEVLAVPPSTYYYQPHPAEDLDVREALEEIALEFPRYGYRRVTAELARRGWQVNHKRVQRLMREANLITEVQGTAKALRTVPIGMGVEKQRDHAQALVAERNGIDITPGVSMTVGVERDCRDSP